MVSATSDKWLTYLTVIVLIIWGITLTPISHYIVSPDAKPFVASFFTACLGLGPALKVMSKR